MSSYRLTPEELRSIDGYKDVTDEGAELIIDDALALARLCLALVDENHETNQNCYNK